MKKILKVWGNIADYVCKFSGDKYVHLIVGLIIAFVFAWLMAVTTKGFPAINYAVCGVTVINSLGTCKYSTSFILSDTQKAALSATEKAVLINKGWTLA